MITHTLITRDVHGHHQHVPLTEEQARDVVAQALEQPPVQFDRLHGAEGWDIHKRGHTTTLVRIRRGDTH